MIKNIFLDLGGVLVDLDQSATLRELHTLGFQEITPEIYELFNKYELGRLSTDDFLRAASEMAETTSRQTLINAWNAIILGFPVSRLQYLEHLKAHYQLFLISNTNALHLKKVADLLGGDLAGFESNFTQCYYSHEINLSKPDKAIFQKVLEDHNLLAEECFFVDDTFVHIQAAAELGIHTWNLQPGREDITQLETKLRNA